MTQASPSQWLGIELEILPAAVFKLFKISWTATPGPPKGSRALHLFPPFIWAAGQKLAPGPNSNQPSLPKPPRSYHPVGFDTCIHNFSVIDSALALITLHFHSSKLKWLPWPPLWMHKDVRSSRPTRRRDWHPKASVNSNTKRQRWWTLWRPNWVFRAQPSSPFSGHSSERDIIDCDDATASKICSG